MLLLVSYNDKEITRKIDTVLGKPFPLMERLKMGGIGSPKLIVTGASVQIGNLMNMDNNRNVCNIEMRPQGIILGFRSRLNAYALIIPYYKLVIFKGNAETYTLHKDTYYISFQALPNEKSVHKFVKKMIDARNNAVPKDVRDL